MFHRFFKTVSQKIPRVNFLKSTRQEAFFGIGCGACLGISMAVYNRRVNTTIPMQSVIPDEIIAEDSRPPQQPYFGQNPIWYIKGFHQHTLITQPNMPDNLKLNSDGACYGLTLTWFAHSCAGKNFIRECDNINETLSGKKQLTPEQISLLHDVNKIQKFNAKNTKALIISNSWIPHLFSSFRIISDESIIENKTYNYKNTDITTQEKFALSILQNAIANEGHLVALFFSNNERRTSHVIGLKASLKNDKPIFQFYDSCFGEVVFLNIESAQDYILDSWNVYTKAGACSDFSASNYFVQEKRQGLFWKVKPAAGTSTDLEAKNTPEFFLAKYSCSL